LQSLKRLSETQQEQVLAFMRSLQQKPTQDIAGLGVPPFVPRSAPRQLGIAKGKYIMHEDFDEPLDELFGL